MKGKSERNLRGGDDRNAFYLDDILFGRRLLAFPALGGFQPPGVQYRLFRLRHKLIFRQRRQLQKKAGTLKN